MLIPLILAILSLITFALYGVDKLLAKTGARRIPERVLLGFSLLGGGVGGALAMMLFRHKTKHLYFVFLNAVGIALQIASIVLAFIYLK